MTVGGFRPWPAEHREKEHRRKEELRLHRQTGSVTSLWTKRVEELAAPPGDEVFEVGQDRRGRTERRRIEDAASAHEEPDHEHPGHVLPGLVAGMAVGDPVRRDVENGPGDEPCEP